MMPSRPASLLVAGAGQLLRYARRRGKSRAVDFLRKSPPKPDRNERRLSPSRRDSLKDAAAWPGRLKLKEIVLARASQAACSVSVHLSLVIIHRPKGRLKGNAATSGHVAVELSGQPRVVSGNWFLAGHGSRRRITSDCCFARADDKRVFTGTEETRPAAARSTCSASRSPSQASAAARRCAATARTAHRRSAATPHHGAPTSRAAHRCAATSRTAATAYCCAATSRTAATAYCCAATSRAAATAYCCAATSRAAAATRRRAFRSCAAHQRTAKSGTNRPITAGFKAPTHDHRAGAGTSGTAAAARATTSGTCRSTCTTIATATGTTSPARAAWTLRTTPIGKAADAPG